MARPTTVTMAIDAVGAKRSGAATVLQEVVSSALATEWVGKMTVYCSPHGSRDFQLPDDPRLVECGVKSASDGGIGRAIWHRYGLPAAVRRNGGSVLLCLAGGGEAPAGVPSVTLIQQSLPFAQDAMDSMPWSARMRMRAMKVLMRRSCGRAAIVVVQTSTMKQWLIRDFGLAAEKVRVIEPGPSVPKSKQRSGRTPVEMAGVAPDRRILYVGNAEPYKNLDILRPAMAALRWDIPEATLFATLPAGHGLRSVPGVVALEPIRRADIADYYRAATVLVMPSLVETVGLPMLEAASVGTMVLAADRPYAHDVCGSSAMFFDPLRPESLADALRKVLGDTELRVRLGGLGQSLAIAKSASNPYAQLIELLHQAIVATQSTADLGSANSCGAS